MTGRKGGMPAGGKMETDVLIAGGGTAGFIAAVAAARNGAKVLLVEPQSFLGGTPTGAMVRGIVSMRHARVRPREESVLYTSEYADDQQIFGLAQEYLDRLIKAQAAWGKTGQATVLQMFDPEIAKWVVEQMVLEAGVEVWLYSQVVEVIKAGKRVTGAVVENALGRVPVKAKVTIDATGDGWVAVYAGADYRQGRDADGLCQAISLCFTIGGVKLEATLQYMEQNIEEFGRKYVEHLRQLKKEGKPLTFPSFKAKMREAIKNGDFPIPYGAERVDPENHFTVFRPVFRSGKVRYDVVAYNTDMAYGVDAANPLQLSKAMMAMRDWAVKMAAYYRRYIPGFEECYLDQTAAMAGIRETRRIVGDYVLTDEDVLRGKTFQDAVGRNGGYADLHDEEGGKGPIRQTEVGTANGGWYHIPYRILLPRGLENLMITGRCVSSERIANASIRGQGACMATGQAAGTAAALAVKKGVSPRSLAVGELQKTLTAQGALIWE